MVAGKESREETAHAPSDHRLQRVPSR
jgi:plastocyanin